MKVLQIIGADLSKKSIDLVCHQRKSHLKIENTHTGFKLMLKWFKQQKINPSEMMMVMEHTGYYSYHLEAFLHHNQIRFTKVAALAIKKSLGLVRGKNDKIDAQRIARYGFEKKDILVAAGKPDPALERLQMLHSTRDRLVRQRSSLKCAVKEYRLLVKGSDLIMKSQTEMIKHFTEQIKKIDAEIKHLITTTLPIRQSFDLAQSVTGVGKVVAVAFIIKTRNFTLFANGRKFACYCGTAPFDHTSGTSIRKKTKVSHLADKTMKTLLDQAARSAIQHDKELKAFYQRRVAAGKSKTSTINIVRNKIIHRTFAVIKRQTPFLKDYQTAA
jgi:transposase